MNFSQLYTQIINFILRGGGSGIKSLIDKVTQKATSQAQPQTNTPPSQFAQCHTNTETPHIQLVQPPMPKNDAKFGTLVAPSEIKAWYRDIIKTEFPQYKIIDFMPVAGVCAKGMDVDFDFINAMAKRQYKVEEGRPFDFGLSRNDELRAVIVLEEGNSRMTRHDYMVSYAFATEKGVTYIDFDIKAENRRFDVIAKIKEMLAK